LVDKGRFKFDEVSWQGPPDVLTIRARSADLTDAFRIRRERKWKATTVGGVLQQIARDNGLQANVAPELAGKPVKVLAQDQRSDAAMLRFLGRRHDAVATVKAGRLIFSPIGKGTTASGRRLPAFSITRQSGDSYSWQRAARESEFAGVEARWHDQEKGERKTVKVDGEGKGKPKRLRRTFHSEDDAQAAAEAESKRVKRAAATFDLTLAYGDAELYPEQKGAVAGFKPSIDATTWLVAEVSHTLDASGGFRTKLQLELDA
jgi:phage protein D